MLASWRELLEGDLAAEAGRTIEAITADLRTLEPTQVQHSKSDLALYFAYLATATGAREHDDLATEWLDSAIADAEDHFRTPALYGGITGLAWAIEHLNTSPDAARSVSADEDPNAGIDELICDVVAQSSIRYGYDLISGLVGFGVYFLERLPRLRAHEGLELILEQLENIAEDGTPGKRWLTPATHLPEWQRYLAPSGYYNLGVAHGIPGIIALLSQCVSRGIALARSETLLEDAMNWLLAREQHGRTDGRFDTWQPVGSSAAQQGSRLAWCYGDPGVAITIFSAGRATGNDEWTRCALDIASNCTRRPKDKAGILDAGLCHGAAGLAHIYNRLFHATEDPTFGEFACRWFQETLEMRGQQGYGGYRTYKPMGPDGTSNATLWHDDHGFLTGTVGIGLALLAATTSILPEWDRMLLASFPASRYVDGL